MKWKIRDVEIENQIVVAPMAGVSNTTFRRICKDMGASLVVAEMVSDKAILYGNEKTFELLKMHEDERPISQQIFGSDVNDFVDAAKIVEEKMKPDIIDINMGCPVPKVALKNQAGSALLKNPEKIREIVSAVVKAVKVPVTVKIRSGWDNNSINAVEVAKVIESSGASAITIHGRTRAQGYSGNADWNIIKEVVKAVNIPVIGNGDVKSCYDAKRMLDETGCAAVMIGRALMGNPWLVKECIDYLNEGKLPREIDYNEKIDMMEYHLEQLVQDKNEAEAVLEMRGHLLNYLKGLPENKEVKNQVCKCRSAKEIVEVLENYRKELILEK